VEYNLVWGFHGPGEDDFVFSKGPLNNMRYCHFASHELKINICCKRKYEHGLTPLYYPLTPSTFGNQALIVQNKHHYTEAPTAFSW